MIAFLISELNIRGGTHKQFLRVIQYAQKMNQEFIIVTHSVDFEKTYPEFKEYSPFIYLLKDISGKKALNLAIALLCNIFLIRKILKKVDVVNIHDSGLFYYHPALVGKKTIWQINDIPGCFGVGFSKHSNVSWRGKLLKSYILLFMPVIDLITVNVTKNKLLVRQCLHRNAEVLYCGIDKLGVEIDICKTYERFDNKTIHLLTSGVLRPYRNYEMLLSVVSMLKEQGYDAYLNIIGSTSLDVEYYKKISNLIDYHKLNNNVKLCGQVNEDTFIQIHQDTDLFVFMNVDQSWGLCVFEAMSCGIPVLVSKSVGATEILHENEDAIFCDPQNAHEITAKIISCITDREKFRYLSEKSIGFSDKYSWDKSYSQNLFELINKML